MGALPPRPVVTGGNAEPIGQVCTSWRQNDVVLGAFVWWNQILEGSVGSGWTKICGENNPDYAVLPGYADLGDVG